MGYKGDNANYNYYISLAGKLIVISGWQLQFDLIGYY